MGKNRAAGEGLGVGKISHEFPATVTLPLRISGQSGLDDPTYSTIKAKASYARFGSNADHERHHLSSLYVNPSPQVEVLQFLSHPTKHQFQEISTDISVSASTHHGRPQSPRHRRHQLNPKLRNLHPAPQSRRPSQRERHRPRTTKSLLRTTRLRMGSSSNRSGGGSGDY
jgi:hypothetical protein